MKKELVAPCGMNCSVCAGFLAREHDVKSKGIKIPYCEGCRPRGKNCAYIKKSCEPLRKKEVEYCYECGSFPCDHLRGLDKRYRTRYKMSEIENLRFIRDMGIEAFLKSEESRWKCLKCGGVVCCHNGICFDCGLEELKKRKKLYRLDDTTD